MTQHPVIVVGAGPGGLCAALTLQRRGVPFVILERAAAERMFSDVGGGYDVGANSLRMLDRLGVGRAIRESGRKLTQVLSYRHTGALFDRMQLPADSDDTAIMRSSLQRVLLAELDPAALRCGASVVDVRSHADGVHVTLADGEELIGSAVLGADGVRSAVRRSILADDAPLHFCGLTCAWGRTPVAELGAELAAGMPPPGAAISMMGPGRLLLAGSLDDHWLWSAFWRTERFERSTDAHATTLREFETWHELGQGLIRRANPETVVEVGIWDRDPAPSWSHARALLLGDAAHPMTPFLGQGANSAMIDGFVVGNLLADASPEDAFAQFAERRKAPLEKNVKSARSLAGWMTTESALSAFAFRAMMQLIPSSLLVRELTAADKVNDVEDLLPRVPALA